MPNNQEIQDAQQLLSLIQEVGKQQFSLSRRNGQVTISSNGQVLSFLEGNPPPIRRTNTILRR